MPGTDTVPGWWRVYGLGLGSHIPSCVMNSQQLRKCWATLEGLLSGVEKQVAGRGGHCADGLSCELLGRVSTNDVHTSSIRH